jgi:hypothetical protein
MAKSTQVITDLKSALATTPSATAQSDAISPLNSGGGAGMIQDITGMINVALIKAEELKKICNDLVLDPSGSGVTNAIIKTGTDSTIFTALDSVRQVLV